MANIATFADDLAAALVRGMARGQQAVKTTAMQESSGPYSQAELTQMDHPYARRHGSPQLPPEIINVQTGQFRADWKVEPVMLNRNEIVARTINENHVADFLQFGTKHMFARPIQPEVEKIAEPLIVREIEKELTRFFKQTYR